MHTMQSSALQDAVLMCLPLQELEQRSAMPQSAAHLILAPPHHTHPPVYRLCMLPSSNNQLVFMPVQDLEYPSLGLNPTLQGPLSLMTAVLGMEPIPA